MIPLSAGQLFLITTAACWMLIIPLRVLLLRVGIIDRPNARSSHTTPVLRGGGVAIILVILGWLIFEKMSCFGLIFPLLALASVSFWDDCRPLGARVRFSVHALAAASTLIWLTYPISSTNQGFSIIFIPVTFVWIIGYTNAFNFMDGINGLAAGQAVITALGAAVIGHAAGLSWSHPAIMLSIVVAGSSGGFLPYNFPQAQIFMGDAGSASLGFLLAIITTWIARDTSWGLGIPLVMLHANFILDTSITLLRRIIKNEKWHEAHREHFYQRLVRAGRSHLFVTGAQIIIQCSVVAMMMLYYSASLYARVGLIAAVICLWLGFFAYAESLFREMTPKSVP